MKHAVMHAPRQKQIAARPESITEFWSKIDEVMKRMEERAFRLFEERGREDGHDLDDWFRAEQELLAPVPITITEKNNELRIHAEVPGFTAEEIALNVEQNALTLQGEHTESKKVEGESNSTESERRQIYSRIVLPADVIPEKAKATWKDGALEIVVPKAVDKSTSIEIKAA
jgi:HSP20 family molecular chaperone IbpA